ncbi:MAG: hypothetical protein K6G61_09025 [Solobacterium sp.]|nr:hypothetical protein [Solobacterium sp.]
MAKNSVKKQKKRNSHLTGVIFWICLILIVTPCAVLGWILFSSAQDTGNPVFGNRYDGDLNPAIQKEQLSQIESSVSSIGGVEKVSVVMPTATLRVYADISDSADSESAKNTANEIYSKVASVLDPKVYFTQGDGKKMYDLEIHVYNLTDNRESDSFVYVIETKTSSMDEPIQQLVSEPIDADLAQRLRDAVIERETATPTPEAVEGGEVEIGGEDLPTEEEMNEQGENGEESGEESGEEGGEENTEEGN